MDYFEVYRGFSTDKQGFFAVRERTTEQTKLEAEGKSFQFLSNNKLLIDQEFDQMFAVLAKQNSDRLDFWLYCYYCSIMLHRYFMAYDKKDMAKKYLLLSEKLKHRCDHGRFQDEINQNSFLHTLKTSIAADLSALVKIPLHVSKLRDCLSLANFCRMHILFCRLTIRHFALLVQELLWLEKLAGVLGQQIDVDAIVATMNAPTAIFSGLSVGIFAARFIINAGVLLKHTFWPTQQEQEFQKKERFYKELYARHCILLNDFVWSCVNMFCNYASVFNIAAPVASWLTAVFLLFDVSLLIYCRHLAEEDYWYKKAQYEFDRTSFKRLLSNAVTPVDSLRHQEQIDLLDEQLKQLEIKRQTDQATFAFKIAAAVLLIGSFSASLLLAIPAAFFVCYFVCTVAVAMYITADLYGKYIEKSLILKQQECDHLDTSNALLDRKTARNHFALTMTKSIVLPLVIMGAIALSWQVALLIVVAYIGYECLRACLNKRPANNSLPQPQPQPEAEAEIEPEVEAVGDVIDPDELELDDQHEPLMASVGL